MIETPKGQRNFLEVMTARKLAALLDCRVRKNFAFPTIGTTRRNTREIVNKVVEMEKHQPSGWRWLGLFPCCNNAIREPLLRNRPLAQGGL